MTPNIQIKGIREGLLVTLGDGEWPQLQEAFLTKVDSQPEFLRGAKLYVDVGNQVLQVVSLSKFRDELSERGLSLWGVLSNSPTTEQTAQVLGLATRLSQPSSKTQQRDNAVSDTSKQEGEDAILVRRTMRSGYQINFAGHVVVIGDVNPGAEIIAAGNVVVWGHLRGVVHAGATGEIDAIVCALDLSPTQLRIAGQVATTPKLHGKPQPEIARLVDGQVVAEIWNPGRHP